MADKFRTCAVDGCNRRPYCKGYCTAHYQQFRKYGDPLGRAKTRMDWLRDHVDHSGSECLMWPFAQNTGGYCRVTIKSKIHVASRVMCELRNGPPPTESHQAAHSCGKGSDGCLNPNHLYWATRSENEADKVEHQTSNRGARQGLSKLNAVDVLGIRLLCRSRMQKEVAAEFGVTRSAVCAIVRRKNWGWINDDVFLCKPERVDSENRTSDDRSSQTVCQ